MITLFSFLFVLFVLVFFHELGHFLAAKSVGVRVEKFYIGFNIFGLGIKKQIGETEYGLGILPLGGYVKMAGMIDESMDAELTGAPWEFQSKNSLQKIWVMSGGVLANLLLAAVVFTIITLSRGIGVSDPRSIVGSLADGYPAGEAGIIAGDIITAIDGEPVENWEQMTALIHTRPEEELLVSWDRDGLSFSAVIKTRSTQTIIGDEIKTVGMIGVAPKIDVHPAGLIEAANRGVSLTGLWMARTYISLKMLFTGKASMRDLGGPILIAQLAGESAQSGFITLLGFLAIISVNLAFINILPVPALDGGHIALELVEVAMRRPLSLRARMAIQQVGIMLLLTLLVVVVYNDIMRLFE